MPNEGDSLALRQDSKVAPPDQLETFEAAIDLCNQLVESGQGRSALMVVRTALRGAHKPDSCKD